MKVLSTYSIKGGVGKTSAAVNLAALAAAEGRRTLVWDLDPQGASTYLFRIKAKVKGGGSKLVRKRGDVIDNAIKGTDIEALDLLPADFSYRHLDLVLNDTKRPERGLARVLEGVADQYDVAILDCPPSISLASESMFSAADLLLVPLIPSTLSVRTLEQLHDFLARQDTPPAVLAYFSMVDRRKRLHREVMESRLAGVAAAAIPSASVVEQMGLHRAPVVQTSPRSPAALAYLDLWREVAAQLDRQPAA